MAPSQAGHLFKVAGAVVAAHPHQMQAAHPNGLALAGQATILFRLPEVRVLPLRAVAAGRQIKALAVLARAAKCAFGRGKITE
jgi:hypothetical protein